MARSWRPAPTFLSVVGGSLDGMWSPLTETEKKMLYLEQGFFKYVGAKHEQIFTALHMTPTRYYQLLNVLIDDPRALAWDPLTVKRLQRLRDARRETRSADRLRSIQG